jgi:hypothetical protein
VRHSGERIVPCRGLIQKDSQHACLASAQELDIYNLEPARAGHPVRDFPHTFNVKRHESNNLLADGSHT